MSSKISASDIRNVHIYNEKTELDLCRRHRSELTESIAGKLNKLVSTKFFQKKFKEFLPNPDSNKEVRLRIRITDRDIIVQQIDEQGCGIGQSQKVHLDDIEDLENEDINEVENINQSILRKANRIYQDHLNESPYRDRSVSPLHERATHFPNSEPNSLKETVTPSSAEELALLKIQKRDLERQVETMSAENEVLKSRLPKPTSLIPSENYDTLIELSQALAASDLWGSTHFPGELKQEFMKLPETVRNAIYYQTYLLVDPLEAIDPWPIGQRLFEGIANSELAVNLCRSHAIRHFLLHTLGGDFANADGKFPPAELTRRFSRLPEEDKSAVYTQLEYVQPKGDDYKGPAHAFAGVDRLSVTNQERSIAINRVTLDRTAEYHRHHYREGIKMLEKAFQEAYENLRQDSLRRQLELERQLREREANVE